jgi:hypothetical protein
MMERRLHTRFPDAELAMLAWEEHAVLIKELANVEDISAEGVGLIIGEALAPGTSVTLTYGGEKLRGVVKHHRPVENGHLIGVELLGESKHAAARFAPDMLVRLD